MGRPSPVELGRGKGPRAGGRRLEAPSGQGSLLCMKCLPRTRGGDSPSRLLPRPPVTHHPGSALLEIFAVWRKVCLSFPTAIKVPRRPSGRNAGSRSRQVSDLGFPEGRRASGGLSLAGLLSWTLRAWPEGAARSPGRPSPGTARRLVAAARTARAGPRGNRGPGALCRGLRRPKPQLHCRP